MVVCLKHVRLSKYIVLLGLIGLDSIMKAFLTILTSTVLLASCGTETTQIYTVSTDVTPENGGSVSYTPSGGSHDEGTQLSFTASASDAYIFSGWQGDLSGTSNPIELTLTKDVSVTALFEIKEYTLDLVVEEGGTVIEEIIQPKTDYNHGTVIRLTAVEDSGLDIVKNNGWIFTGWTGDVNSDQSILELTIEKPLSLRANFERSPFPHGITWDNVIERRGDLPELIFNQTLILIEENRKIQGYNEIPYAVYRGPNLAEKHYVNFDIWVDDVFSLNARALKPDSETFIMFPFEDVEWAVNLVKSSEVNHLGYEIIIRQANQDSSQGIRQNAIPNQPVGRFDGIWVLPATLGPGGAYTSYTMHEKAAFSHEYGHQVQQAQWKDENLNGPFQGMNRDAPCFLIEGIVTIPELVLSLSSPQEFEQSIRERILGAYTSDPNSLDEYGNFTRYQPLQEEVTIEFARSYLQDSFEMKCNQGLYYGLSYSLGYLATEALASIGGIESPMALFTLMGSNNLEWNESFEKVYRISWDEAEPILAEYIYLQARAYGL